MSRNSTQELRKKIAAQLYHAAERKLALLMTDDSEIPPLIQIVAAFQLAEKMYSLADEPEQLEIEQFKIEFIEIDASKQIQE
jgi:hypothetical protein